MVVDERGLWHQEDPLQLDVVPREIAQKLPDSPILLKIQMPDVQKKKMEMPQKSFVQPNSRAPFPLDEIS